MSEIATLLSGARVMAILTVDDAKSAAPLARALYAGGLRACEVTLRTPAALEAIAIMRAEAPDLVVGAGTIRTVHDIEHARGAGAQFLVTPGATPALINALADADAPVLPGAATPSEMMTLAEKGHRTLKFFPAEQAGGVALLDAVFGPLPELRFWPTGGITRELAPTYLARPNVMGVGGSWIAPQTALARGDFDAIEANARFAATL